MNVFVTSGKVGDDKTIIGFGSLQEYEGQKPNARDVFNKINSIDAFLKSVDADKIPLNLKVGNKETGETYMKADAYYQKGISKDGKAYAFNKIAIEIQPEKRNEAGELMQNAEKLYATKTKEGYAFDKTNDDAIIDKFNSLIKDGVDFTLSATKNTTLEKYPNLMQVVNKIDKSANIEIDFVQSQGAVIKSIQSPAGNKLESGTEQIMNYAKDKSMDR
ncbi:MULTISPECIES: hypothetical protein [unclassified Campylobacter]|uniref:hypothetical protein n=1 Tax=unclassified Campylobacter TaxID=2593542 RepID=UPI001D8992B4|nr:hypothetical protein [Campylobacter sp. RM12651]MBZ7978529.1 hypothetical protein [Campylobacter sp. RM12654]MBZ7980446.1 hypothetical protein [Campylobacter sp. RM12642]MBZ7990605.1 hypothetical protein [Campylobacter sp. RM9331]MBZ8004756.1 hypothetical protein [Campylobacter sp. RM9332]MBZ8007127.1 hypothetical protein [Campylobacter sp. RM9334]